ncbi:Tol-Pal system beta propeller repeat protein TolB [Lacibacterium aquatile]|uniref:Tol-Pal system protein TolB n=1 Tax=Lacibacterium aquatile TaxID=1168082 RepID=A0ABW5DRS7_9PROT
MKRVSTVTLWRQACAGAILAVAMAAGSAFPAAAAEPRVDITSPNFQPMPIAVTTLTGDERLAREITAIVSADLERSGLFRPIDPAAWPQKPADIGTAPRYADWRLVNAQALVTGAVTVQPDGRIRVEFRLWDVYGEAYMEGAAWVTGTDNFRRMAHKIADGVYKRLTGEDGYFDTEIVFVAEKGPATRRIKQLALMDQDGARLRLLTDENRVVALTPRFSPVAREITYMAYVNDKPRVYLYDIETGKQEALGDFPGMTFAPRFSPDGQRVIMSFAQGGNSDIYTMDLRTRRSQRLTDHPSIDTSPSYSPDGNRIVFNSDRGGSSQLYIMNADGSNPQRISPSGSARYMTPVWSPRGDYIAFTKQAQGQFSVGVMRPDGTGERILSTSYLDEGPTWAPNGRVLMFFRQSPSDGSGRGGASQLVSVDITGRNLRTQVTPMDASDPAWSPSLN